MDRREYLSEMASHDLRMDAGDELQEWNDPVLERELVERYLAMRLLLDEYRRRPREVQSAQAANMAELEAQLESVEPAIVAIIEELEPGVINWDTSRYYLPDLE